VQFERKRRRCNSIDDKGGEKDGVPLMMEEEKPRRRRS
jgi:hypothetical protein